MSLKTEKIGIENELPYGGDPKLAAYCIGLRLSILASLPAWDRRIEDVADTKQEASK